MLEEGEEAEAVTLLPPAPLLLFNGGGGIGTGWSTNVWPRHPLSVCEGQRKMIACLGARAPALGAAIESERDALEGRIAVAPCPWDALLPARLAEFDAREPLEEWERFVDAMEPYFHRFKGRVVRASDKQFVTYGRLQAYRDARSVWLEISELPIHVWQEEVKEALEALEANSTPVGAKRAREEDEAAKPAKAAGGRGKLKEACRGLVRDVHIFSNEHAIRLVVQCNAEILSRWVDTAALTSEPVEVESDELLALLALRNTHTTSNMHGLVKPALTAARDEQVLTPRGPWVRELNGDEALESLNVWPEEQWIINCRRLSTLYVIHAKYRIAGYLRRLAYEREILRRKHLKKREIYRFLRLLHEG